MNSEKKAYQVIVSVSIAIFIFLTWLIYFKARSETNLVFMNCLPYCNAFFNSLTSVLLINGLIQIKKNRIDLHKKLMLLATVSSAFFLVSYIVYHNFHGDTKFVATGTIRGIYFFILISHIILSAIQVPLILSTLYLAFTGKTIKHKKVARITFPIWLYVSITGVLIFVFLNWFNQ
jgi:putative membrane protein